MKAAIDAGSLPSGPPPRRLPMSLHLLYLKSSRGMGSVSFVCTAGCTCATSTINASDTVPTSLSVLHSVRVLASTDPCAVRVRG